MTGGEVQTSTVSLRRCELSAARRRAVGGPAFRSNPLIRQGKQASRPDVIIVQNRNIKSQMSQSWDGPRDRCLLETPLESAGHPGKPHGSAAREFVEKTIDKVAHDGTRPHRGLKYSRLCQPLLTCERTWVSQTAVIYSLQIGYCELCRCPGQGVDELIPLSNQRLLDEHTVSALSDLDATPASSG